MLVAVLAITLVLAFANGANDVSKGISTLVGSGVTNYLRAVAWGALFTVAGALTAGFASQALVETFSGKGILAASSTSPAFLFAVACGATGWLFIATRTGMPVSTTHSLAGALIGAALVHTGGNAVLWSALAAKIALPLAASPLMSLGLVLIVIPALRPLLAKFDRPCVCVEEAVPAMATPDGLTFRAAAPSLTVGTANLTITAPSLTIGTAQSCATSTARLDVVDALHWLSAGATSFFRALNDTPKILALSVLAAATLGITRLPMYAAVGAAMGIGSLLAGIRVTRTLAEKVTRISPPNGLAANVITATLVALASRYALPVSTTHVSSGAIVGIGVARGDGAVRWHTVREMALAWLVTLPASAILGAIAALTLHP